MTTPRVLIADKMSPKAERIFKDRGLEVDVKTGLERDRLIEIIGDYDGLAVRSATKVTQKVIAAADRLKVIGRAGIGVDNIDIPAATAKGIIIMNTPLGNSITTAEHAISLLLALARQIPAANASTQAGKWEKSRFMGVEITGKTLGIIGCGNIGSIVAERALGLKMRVIAYDPFLSRERALDIGIEKVKLDELLKRSDFISLHVPLTDKTRDIIDAKTIAAMKPGVRIINCARGGLIVEPALGEALLSGHVGGAALDVYREEPAFENPLFGIENMICTPHLGASTSEAQEKVALQVAEQMSDYLLTGAVSNAINMPSISAEEATRLTPFLALAEKLGLFAGQLTETGLKGVSIEYAGEVGDLNTRALTSALLAGLLKPILQDVNMVSAPALAEERGIAVEEIRHGKAGAYDNYIRLVVKTDRQERSVAGTVFSDGKPRVIQVKGINMEAEFAQHMLYLNSEDKPGLIGALGSTLGDAGVNIATFHLGRSKPGGDVIAILQVDDAVDDEVIASVRKLPHVHLAKRLKF